MIHEISIKNFQSLEDVSLPLSRFTVILGKSSSGKSAFMRALRTLTSNRKGTDWITHGEQSATITARNDLGTVTLGRSHSQSGNYYLVTPVDAQHALAPQRQFLKLAGATPPEVSDFLGIPAGSPLNYAGQFDKPFLLDESSSEVARVLGELTNVSLVFNAARESNRRKQAHSATLKTRITDLDSVKARIPAFKRLKGRDEALQRAEALIAQATEAKEELLALQQLITQRAVAGEAVVKFSAVAGRKVPSIDGLLATAQELTELVEAVRSRVSASNDLERISTAKSTYSDALGTAEGLLHDVLSSGVTDIESWIRETTQIDENDRVAVADASQAVLTYLEARS